MALIMSGWAIKNKPMIDKLNNIVLITNELVILFSSYFVLVFSDYVPRVEQRYKFGYLYLAFFLFESLVNVLMLLVILKRDFSLMLKRRQLRKQINQKQTE